MKRKVTQYLIVAILLAAFGLAGLVGACNALFDMASWKPKPPVSTATTQLLPHLFLLLAWPASIICALKAKHAWIVKGSGITQVVHLEGSYDDPEPPAIDRRI